MFLWLSMAFCRAASGETDTAVARFLENDFSKMTSRSPDSIHVRRLLASMERCIDDRSDSALYYADEAILLAVRSGLASGVSTALQGKYRHFVSREDYEPACQCIIYAIRIEEKLNRKERLAELNDQLGTLYYYQEVFNKSLEYLSLSLDMYRRLGNRKGEARVLSHLGSLYVSREYCEKRTPEEYKNDHHIALDNFQKALAIYNALGLRDSEAYTWMNIGNVYRRLDLAGDALSYLQKALDYFRQGDDIRSRVQAMRTLGNNYVQLKRYKDAIHLFREAQKTMQSENMKEGLQYLYEDMAEAYDFLGEYKNARDCYIQYMVIRDSVYNYEKSKLIIEMETKYQTEKKQNEIERLHLIGKQRNQIILIVSLLLVMVLLLAYFYSRNLANKKIIAEQNLKIREKQLQELEKERQILAARSVLQGEEAERHRFARELHDGLGGMLTGIKLNLSSMKENSIITSENLAHFNHALVLLDTSISEMRRVAQNLMPETLMHYGLQTALHDFAEQVQSGGKPEIRFVCFGNPQRYSEELEIAVYRITQELLTNALKHSKAESIEVQLFTEADRISVQVIDNGAGFDIAQVQEHSQGKGLKNIGDRVAMLNGRFDILSEPGKGTEITLEFHIG